MARWASTSMPTAVTVPRRRVSPLAEVIYRTLVLQGPASCGRLSRELGVEPARIGDGVHELAAAGAVRRAGADGPQSRWRVQEAGAGVPAPAAIEPPPPPQITLTHREQAVVSLLAKGASDEEVAAELGLSRRTVVYAMRALMDRLGVDNRFQLALVLGAARAVRRPAA